MAFTSEKDATEDNGDVSCDEGVDSDENSNAVKVGIASPKGKIGSTYIGAYAPKSKVAK
jgi:hypothetical protein